MVDNCSWQQMLTGSSSELVFPLHLFAVIRKQDVWQNGGIDFCNMPGAISQTQRIINFSDGSLSAVYAAALFLQPEEEGLKCICCLIQASHDLLYSPPYLPMTS